MFESVEKIALLYKKTKIQQERVDGINKKASTANQHSTLAAEFISHKCLFPQVFQTGNFCVQVAQELVVTTPALQ